MRTQSKIISLTFVRHGQSEGNVQKVMQVNDYSIDRIFLKSLNKITKIDIQILINVSLFIIISRDKLLDFL